MRNHHNHTLSRGSAQSGLAFAVLVLFLIVPFWSLAQTDSVLRNHVIIAFDNALPESYRNYLVNSRQSILDGATRLLGADGLQRLKKGDYLSVVNFVMGTDNSSMNDFAAPSRDGSGKEIAWREFDSFNSLLDGDWADIVYNQGINRAKGDKFSLLSGAKAYSVGALHGKNRNAAGDTLTANRTWLLLVTDDFHNGNDNFMKEFQVFKGMGAIADEKSFRSFCNRFSRNFITELSGDITLATAGQLPYRLMLYEVRPAATTSLAGVVDYPASLNIKRVPGGYAIDFDAVSVDSLYTLVKMQVDVMATDRHIISATSTPAATNSPVHIEMSIDKDDIDPSHVEVAVKGWLKQNDDIYGSHVWNPYDSEASRLSTRSTIRCADRGTVFGIELPDSMWLFCRHDIRMAAFIWEVIFVLILVIAVVIAIIILNKRSLRYIPANDEFSIRRAGKN